MLHKKGHLGHISQNPNDLCKIFFTSFNLCSLIILSKGN